MKRIVMPILLCLLTMPLFGRVYLVSVGIADYPGSENDLRVSGEDAKTISKIFLATKNASVQTLTNENATQGGILSSMHTLFTGAGNDDTIMLYFSGHGTEGALVCYDGLLSYGHISKMLNGYQAKQKIIIVDACYAGKMRTSKQHSSDYNDQNVMFFLSSRTNEESKESPFKNSLFTIFLERGLRGGADSDRNRIITACELYDFVHNGVVEASNGKQHPVMWGKFNNNMTVIKW